MPLFILFANTVVKGEEKGEKKGENTWGEDYRRRKILITVRLSA